MCRVICKTNLHKNCTTQKRGHHEMQGAIEQNGKKLKFYFYNNFISLKDKSWKIEMQMPE